MDAQELKFKKMTEQPVEKLVCSLALPCIVSMLVTAFYNMADTYFVGMLDNTAATGAVGVVFSMMSIIQAVGFFFGQGGGTFISMSLGKKQYDNASEMAAISFFSSLVTGLAICLLGQLFLNPLSYLLGSTDTILPYTRDYLRAILCGAPWVAASFTLNNQLRFQGGAFYAMIGITTGAAINVVLDPLLILPEYMDMGVAGAGWATVISQFVSFCLLYAGTWRGTNIRIRLRNFRLKKHYYYMILRGGLPSLSRQCLASVATITLNNVARPMGDTVIAAMGVVRRVSQFGASAMIGFGQGFQPVCGFNYGAKLYDRVKKGFWFSFKVAACGLTVVSALGFIFAPELIRLFRDDPQVVAFGAVALRFQCLTLSFHSWIVMSNMMCQSMNRTASATFLATARQGLFFIPTVLILSATLGELGVQMNQMCADTLTLLCAIPIQIHALKTIDKK